MIWNDHSRDVPEGAHAFLGASNHSWVNYDDDKLVRVYSNLQAKTLGTRLHSFAHECIELGQRLPKSKKTLNSFVNDAIGFKMRSEQPLYLSKNAFGTADAISYQEKAKFVRIHDLKTGVTPASMTQLKIYLAYFCLEYNIDPMKIGAELRIYQNDQIIFHEPDPKEIRDIMNKAVHFDEILSDIQLGE